jgi:hypothetical protein
VAGQEIKTTGEHPFWVAGKGWTPVNELQPGDLLRGDDGQLYPVESVTATDEWLPVYNARIADYHTYYVCAPGSNVWLWAHNQCEKHHPTFKYVLRGIKRFLTETTKRELPKIRQNLVKLSQDVHRTLHKTFDKMDNGKFARYLGRWNIYDKLKDGTVKLERLFDMMESATKKALKNMPEMEQCLSELRRVRNLLIPKAP